MKKLLLFSLLLIPFISFSQPYTGLVLNCYPVKLSQNDISLNCPLEICITQDIECCSNIAVEQGGGTPVYSVTEVTTCRTVQPDGNFYNVCFYEPDPLASYECGCTVIYTSVSIIRHTPFGDDIVNVPAGAVGLFLSILKGVDTHISMALPSFHKDCAGSEYLNYLVWQYAGTNDGTELLVEHF
jgi:hypothetical protein